MTEKDIFKIIKEAFNANYLLKNIKLWSFKIEENTKPFIIFQGEVTAKNTALIYLVIESDYKGLAEVSTLKKEIKTVLSLSSFEDEGGRYAFKKESTNQKKNELTFRVKCFKIGD